MGLLGAQGSIGKCGAAGQEEPWARLHQRRRKKSHVPRPEWGFIGGSRPHGDGTISHPTPTEPRLQLGATQGHPWLCWGPPSTPSSVPAGPTPLSSSEEHRVVPLCMPWSTTDSGRDIAT